MTPVLIAFLLLYGIHNNSNYYFGQNQIPDSYNVLLTYITHLMENNSIVLNPDNIWNDYDDDNNVDLHFRGYSKGDHLVEIGEYPNTTELINRRGYKAEIHHVTTEDGYILTLTRIATGYESPYTPVLLQHGVLAASDQWLLRGHDADLAFILADNGFDVWLGDQRGNVNSRDHINYDPDENKFWDFSFHECGLYDIPAFINKIQNITTAPKITYIGHSMGTTVFFVMASQRPEYANRVQLAILLAPVCYPPKKSQSSILKSLLGYSDFLSTSLDFLGVHEFFPRSLKLQLSIQDMCRPGVLINVCLDIIGNINGENRKNLDRKMVPIYLSSIPAGTSLKNLKHFAQLFTTGKFQQYDYGTIENLKRYSSLYPPRYEIENIQTPIALMYGNNDGFSNREGVKKAADELPNVAMLHEVSDPSFTHLDFMFGNNAKELVYDKILELIKSFNYKI